MRKPRCHRHRGFSCHMCQHPHPTTGHCEPVRRLAWQSRPAMRPPSVILSERSESKDPTRRCADLRRKRLPLRQKSRFLPAPLTRGAFFALRARNVVGAVSYKIPGHCEPVRRLAWQSPPVMRPPSVILSERSESKDLTRRCVDLRRERLPLRQKSRFLPAPLTRGAFAVRSTKGILRLALRACSE